MKREKLSKGAFEGLLELQKLDEAARAAAVPKGRRRKKSIGLGDPASAVASVWQAAQGAPQVGAVAAQAAQTAQGRFRKRPDDMLGVSSAFGSLSKLAASVRAPPAGQPLRIFRQVQLNMNPTNLVVGHLYAPDQVSAERLGATQPVSCQKANLLLM